MRDLMVVKNLNSFSNTDTHLNRHQLVHTVPWHFTKTLPKTPALTELRDVHHVLVGLLDFVDFEYMRAIHLHEILIDVLLFEQILHLLGTFFH
jgi:hypothetical protein